MRARVINHDHRSIRQITDRLVRFAALFDEMQIELVAGNNTRPQGASKIG